MDAPAPPADSNDNAAQRLDALELALAGTGRNCGGPHANPKSGSGSAVGNRGHEAGPWPGPGLVRNGARPAAALGATRCTRRGTGLPGGGTHGVEFPP